MNDAETRIAAALRTSEGKRSVTLRREDVRETMSLVRYWQEIARVRGEIRNRLYLDLDESHMATLARIPFRNAWCIAVILSLAAALGGYLMGHG